MSPPVRSLTHKSWAVVVCARAVYELKVEKLEVALLSIFTTLLI